MQNLLGASVLLATSIAMSSNAKAAGLPLPPPEYQPRAYSWQLFTSGEYTLQCSPTGSFVRFGGQCVSGDCMCEPGIEQTKSLMQMRQQNEWRNLASAIIYQQEQKRGLHPADFYYVMLAQAALGLDNKQAAIAYYRKARSAQYSCLRFGRADDGRTCGGAAQFKQGWIELPLRNLEMSIANERRAEEERQRQAVEASRQQAELARQAEIAERREEEVRAARAMRFEQLKGRFPEGWVEPILRGEVQVGFSKAAVLEAIGRPMKIVSVSGGAEMWVYSDKRLVFKEDRLTFIES